MDDMKKPGAANQAMAAKMEVVKELRKMAMELLAGGLDDGKGDDMDDHGGAVVAKLDLQKLPSDEGMDDAEMAEDPAEEAAESPEEEKAEGEPDSTQQSDLIERMLAKRKMMR